MIKEVELLINMAKIAVERIDGGLALGEQLDVSPLRQAIHDAQQALVDATAIQKTELEQAKRDGYAESTKGAIEMALFNIPYICKFQNAPARLVGIVIPDDDWKTIRPLLKDGDIGLDGKPIKITKESLEIYKDGVFDD